MARNRLDIQLRDRELQALYEATGIDPKELLKCREQGLLDPRRVLSVLVRSDYRRLRATSGFSADDIKAALAKRYDIDLKLVTRMLAEGNRKEYFCEVCGSLIPRPTSKPETRLCKECRRDKAEELLYG